MTARFERCEVFLSIFTTDTSCGNVISDFVTYSILLLGALRFEEVQEKFSTLISASAGIISENVATPLHSENSDATSVAFHTGVGSAEARDKGGPQSP